MNTIKLRDVSDYISSLETPISTLEIGISSTIPIKVSSSFYIQGGEIFYKKITIGASPIHIGMDRTIGVPCKIKLFYNNILTRITVNDESFYNENATIADIVDSLKRAI